MISTHLSYPFQQWKNSGDGYFDSSDPLSSSHLLYRLLGLALFFFQIYAGYHVSPSGLLEVPLIILIRPRRGCKISLARCGGVTHWALTPDEQNDFPIMTVAWGQNATYGMHH